MLPGCAGSAGTIQPGGRVPIATPTSNDDRAALVDGMLLRREDLWPLLAERAGAAGLEALALDRAVARAAERAGITVDQADLDAERRVVEMALAGVGLSDSQQRSRVVAQARARRGWGPAWYASLLRRNALARKLVRADVPEPDESAIRRAYEGLYGPRRRVRVIVTASEREAAGLADRVAQGLAESAEVGQARMVMLAVDHSRDESAARGGLLDPISRVDPTYPDAFRRAVFETPVGSLTPVVALDEGFAVALVLEAIDGQDVPLESVRDELAQRVRLEDQQRAMARLLDDLRAQMRIEPLDPSLAWSWRWTIDPPAP
ncbi:MAG: hypothetical protein KatS3mg103_0014 [Phycisphaerales bacterium]|nr:MAG: hypothetical protein KatS3mg103_0014 [Phycisphaerales bacterium]